MENSNIFHQILKLFGGVYHLYEYISKMDFTDRKRAKGNLKSEIHIHCIWKVCKHNLYFPYNLMRFFLLWIECDNEFRSYSTWNHLAIMLNSSKSGVRGTHCLFASVLSCCAHRNHLIRLFFGWHAAFCQLILWLVQCYLLSFPVAGTY